MPARPSTRLGLHAPSGGDPADVPADVQRLRDQLDVAALVYGQGRLAARPAAGVEGRLYYATDDRALYYDFGGGWMPAAWQPGMIQWSAAATTPPLGWLRAEGQILRQSTYPALFAAISFEYSGGREPSAGNFKLPDMRGRMMVGTAALFPLGRAAGAETHTLAQSEMPWHDHGLDRQILGFGPAPHDASVDAGAGGTGNFDIDYLSLAPAGGSAPHNNMPPYVALNAWIRI